MLFGKGRAFLDTFSVYCPKLSFPGDSRKLTSSGPVRSIGLNKHISITSQNGTKWYGLGAGFLHLSPLGILGQIILCYGAALCIVGCLIISPASIH